MYSSSQLDEHQTENVEARGNYSLNFEETKSSGFWYILFTKIAIFSVVSQAKRFVTNLGFLGQQ